MIAIIRISGMVDIPGDIKETLDRILLRRKYALVLMSLTKEKKGILQKIRNHVAYGEINPKTLENLIKKRGKPIKSGAKIDAEKIISQLDKKDLISLGLKPFFRLHPPRGGIDSKNHFGTSKKAVLGDNKGKINDLIERML